MAHTIDFPIIKVQGTPTTYKRKDSKWKQAVVRDTKAAWGTQKIERDTRLEMNITFYLKKKDTDYHEHRSDLDNLLGPTIDAMASVICQSNPKNKDNFEDYLIYRIIAEKFPIEDNEDEGATIILAPY